MSEVQVTLEQVVDLVKTDAAVKEAIKGEFQTDINPDSFKAYLDTDAGKQAAQSYVDSKVSKGIDAWKNNNLQKEIDTAILKANPGDTPEQRQIKELTLKFEAQQQATKHAEQKAYALNQLQTRQLPIGLVDRFVGNSPEETLFLVNQYESEWKSSLQTAVEGLTGATGRRHLPDNPNTQQQVGTPERKLSQMSLTEQTSLYQRNPQEYNRLSAME